MIAHDFYMGWTRAQWATVLRTWLVRRAVEPELSESWMSDCGMCIPEPSVGALLSAKQWWSSAELGEPSETLAGPAMTAYVDSCMRMYYMSSLHNLQNVAMQQSALAQQLAGTQQQTGSLIPGLFGGVIGGIFG